MFSSIKTLALSVFSIAIAAHLVTAVPLLPTDSNQLIPTLQAVTAISQDMNNALTAWSSFATSPQAVAAITSGFANIDDRLTANVVVLGASEPYDDDSATPAITALNKFVNVHGKMLQMLIAKHEVIAPVPVLGVPVAASLRSHEGIFETFGNALIGILPTREEAVTKDVRALEELISRARSTYS